jgi:MYXO-CTERM domain-containing protein
VGGALEAATFTYSFSNVQGPVSGTVTGTIVLPDGDGTFAATDVTVTSEPDLLGYSGIFDVIGYTYVPSNTFTVFDGQITAGTFAAQNSMIPIPTFTCMALNFEDGTFGSLLNVEGNTLAGSGVQDLDSTTLSYSPASSSTPEPATFGLGAAALALIALRRRSQASR